MSKKKISVFLALLFVAGSAAATPTKSHKTLTAFASEQELSALFKGWREEMERRRDSARRERSLSDQAAGPAGQAAAAKSAAPAALASMAAAESVTNTQHAGVDEGGIVKLHGEHLVILRRGRLFTVAVNDRASANTLRPVSMVDAFGAEADPRGAWYDEMLISGSTIAVIGYSYARGGTEIGLFEISPQGHLSYKSTYHLRSNDYYSSRNYASRLIGSKLVFYTPLHLNPYSADPYAQFPALRRWRPGASPAEFKRIAPATRIYRTDEPLRPEQGLALHSVTVCELAKPEMSCESSAVLGAPGRVFYVSPSSVYVWNVRSGVFRLPLDGTAPAALKASGSPVDQFSFLESEDGHLNVLLRSTGRNGGLGDGMWGAEHNAGELALLRMPLASFSDGRDSAPASAYRNLPRPSGQALQNRFVGEYLLYGAGAGGRRPPQFSSGMQGTRDMYAVRYAARNGIYELPLAHGVERIEPLGNNALAVGSDGRDLHFTSLRLGDLPLVSERYTRKNASQGETRSHGFFYKPENEYDGLIGLPIIGGGQASSRNLRHESASLLYLRNDSLSLRELGTLDSRPVGMKDGCKASCVDWYGNSRPLFLRNRVFALMGYEIVEGRLAADKIVETRRISFAPGQADEIAR
jgi:hypothetical protein